ncbi:nitrate- and nitrite sensing domain-containing protein [Isoptericola sp. S6320L]|uniref:sensor histidine kinase n=1 Tax=Isoptericola sp. S6320L TaxID=2926411 RepID=UPI001FF55234|nr:nitrate- and nitrite sensing domain-containing protein [Isoptericola sp. S6320L]MCK0118777.1 nitrate- and nitrite sensing domain-containing protein [Isoptericola sp. S6320L]
MPIFVLLLAATYISWGALQDMIQSSQTSSLVDSLELQDRAGTAMAAERALSVAALNDVEGAMDRLVEAQEQTDEAVDARNDALAALDTDLLSTNVRDAINATLEDRRAVDDLQTDVIAGQITPASATAQYGELIERALNIPRALSAASTDSALAERLNAYVAMDEAMLANTYERPIVALGLAEAARAAAAGPNETPNGDLMSQMVTALNTTDELRAAAQDRVDRLGLGIQLPAYSDELDALRFQLQFLDFSRINQRDAAAWSELSQSWIDQMQPVRDEVRAETVTYAQDVSDAARNQAIGTLVATFGIVLLSLVIALVIARRIVSPLRRLTVATADVRERLPQMVEQMAVPGQSPDIDLVQIPVESDDEIGRLAHAFNQVNETTMEVAREQAALRGSIAEMFVNVARRDQVLLNRQLAFLDELERSEEDASTLSNLFRLDHLATRMRRNAESLLVLAGIDSGRRVRNPMPVSDVIRTASSEIELYDRVRLSLHTDPQMLGHNALNAAHLIAELLENATMFSEPHTPVEVSTARDERGVVVTVRDHGLGMSAEEIAEANHKVASTTASDAVGAQRLGLFVVGRLAVRLRAVVEFSAGQGGKGTTVTVAFPSELFLADDAVPLPQPTDPLETTTQQAVAQIGQEPAQTGLTTAVPATVPADPRTASSPSAPAPVAAQAPESRYAEEGTIDRRPTSAMPMPAARPQPVDHRQSVQSSFGMPQPEPPTAQPVDLDALTDGTTSTGMPRRRRGDEGLPTESIVLPPLATPHMDESAAEQTEDASWSPPSEVAMSGSSLPSRQRPSEGAQEPSAHSGAMPLLPQDEPPAAPIEPEQRTGLFSSFRSMERLEEGAGDGTLQLDAVTDDPADVPVAFSPVAEEPEPARSPSVAAPAPATAPAPSAPVQSEPTRSEPVAAERGRDETAESEDSGFTSLPAFEDLMSDLPNRRGEAAPAQGSRKRGLFGRKPAVAETAAAAADSVTNGSSAEPVGSARGVDPLTSPTLAVSADSAGSAPDRSALQPVQEAPRPDSGWPQAPRAAEPQPFAPERPAPVAYQPPVVEDVPLPTPRPAEPAPAEEPAAPAFAASADEGRPVARSYGESVLPLRATGDAKADPLDPHYVPDTVEARSEWMASAVLYEEMSTLMQRGVFQEENVTTSNEEQTYRPTAVAPVAANGLARRSRNAEQPASADRFSARIERDPEQLRARLSAFQSATARGRSEATG